MQVASVAVFQEAIQGTTNMVPFDHSNQVGMWRDHSHDIKLSLYVCLPIKFHHFASELDVVAPSLNNHPKPSLP
jgi:hypothetical protein